MIMNQTISGGDVPLVMDIGSFHGQPGPSMVHETVSGRATLLGGELWAASDLLIETRFEGKLDIQDHCLIIAAGGQVKAEIHARDVIVFGKVEGRISASGKVKLCEGSFVTGELIAPGVVIEEGAYLKAIIDIVPRGKRVTPDPNFLFQGADRLAGWDHTEKGAVSV